MLKSFFEKISPSLKERVCIEMFYDVMKDNAQIYSAVMRIAKEYRIENPNPPLTQKQAEEGIIKPIVARMETMLVKPDHLIIEKLDDKKTLYIVAKGECEVDFRNGNLHNQDTSQLLRKAQNLCGIESAEEIKKENNETDKILR